MQGTYDLWLVACSYLVAAVASYAALELAGRVAASSARASWVWIAAGSVAMGLGIWSMHFIGMLAFHLPIPLAYDLSITLLSVVPAILASALALGLIRGGHLSGVRLALGAIVMGGGIAAMHYTGMAAIPVVPAIRYDPLIFIASIAVAIAVAFAALWLAFSLAGSRSHAKKFGAALVMGAAVCAMHYTGMAAANFAPGSVCVVSPGALSSPWLAEIVALNTLVILLATMAIALFDARLSDQNARAAQALKAANEQLRLALDASKLAQFEWNLQTGDVFLSERWAEIAGYAPGPTRTSIQVLTDMIHPEDADKVKSLVYNLVKGHTAFYEAEHRFRTASGEYVWVQSHGKVVERDSAGRAVRVSGTNADVTERKQSEQALKEAYERLGSGVRALEQRNREITLLAELSNFLLSCVTVEEACDTIPRYGEMLFPDAQCALFLMRSSKDYLTAHASWGSPAGDYPPFRPEDCWALRRGRIHAVADPAAEPICAHVAPVHGPDHRPYLCVPLIVQSDLIGLLWIAFRPGTALSGERAAEEHGNRQLAVALSEQIALAVSNIRLRENLRQQTIRDPLTGLYNRRFLEESLNREIARSKRSGAGFALLVIDVDHFKRFNDTYGHDAGDSVLHLVGRALQDTCREGDIACRYGGEEFVIVLPDTDRQGAAVLSTRILDLVRSLKLSDGGKSLGRITVSLGLATFPGNGETAKAIVQSADKALYAAKGAGRDRMIAAGEEPASIEPAERAGSKAASAAIEAASIERRGRRKPAKSRH